MVSELKDTKSPLRRYIVENFPNSLALRKEFRARSGPLLVAGNGTSPMTLGTAFDVMARLLIDPEHYPVNFLRSNIWREQHEEAGEQLVRIASDSLTGGPAAAESFYRASWALALLTEIYRSPFAWTDGPVNPILLAEGATLKSSVSALLALTPDSAVEQLNELREVAEASLIPQLKTPVNLEPDLLGSILIPATADIIAGGVLVDMKVQLGLPNSKTGVRSDEMTILTVHQLIGYTLLDLNNDHKLEHLGIYSARYGALTTWPIQEAFNVLAGRPVDIALMRKQLPALLRSGFAR